MFFGQAQSRQRPRQRVLRFEMLEDRSVPAVDLMGPAGDLIQEDEQVVPVPSVPSTPAPIVLSPALTQSAPGVFPNLGGNVSPQNNPGAAAGEIIAESAIDGPFRGGAMLTAAALDTQSQLAAAQDLTRNPLVVDRAILGLNLDLGLGTPVGSGGVVPTDTLPSSEEHTVNRLSDTPPDSSRPRFIGGYWWNFSRDNQWLFWDGSGWQPFDQGEAATARGGTRETLTR